MYTRRCNIKGINMDDEKTIYRCYYKFGDYSNNYVEGTQGPSMFKDGFWINKDFEYTNGDDCKFWIPPAGIKYIEKIKP